MVDVGVADAEVEPDAGAALGEDVVRRRDDFHAVDESLEDVADDGCLDQVAVLDPVLRADAPCQ